MNKPLGYLTIPHITTFKRRWVRRVMIVLALPQESFLALRGVYRGAAHWWKL